MIRWAQGALFLLFSIIDVQVRAGIVALPNQPEPLQEPAGCLWNESQCALKTSSDRKFRTQIGASEVVIGPDSIVIRLDSSALLLVSGEVWVKTSGQFYVRSEFGDYRVIEGEGWIVRDEKSVLVRSLRGEGVVFSRNRPEDLPLLPGFEVRLGGVGKSGGGSLSIPTVIMFRDHLKRWARLYSGTKKEFVHEIHKFDPVLREAAVQASEMHEGLIKRQLASENIENQRLREQRRKYDEETARIRKLFRERANR
jgi:hypothetical protein